MATKSSSSSSSISMENRFHSDRSEIWNRLLHCTSAAANFVGLGLVVLTSPLRAVGSLVRHVGAVVSGNNGNRGVTTSASSPSQDNHDASVGRVKFELVDFGDSIHSDVLTVGNIDKARAIAVVIPGNPGNNAFYMLYLSHLERASNGEICGVALSHLGHSQRSEPDSSQHFGYAEQVAQKAKFLQYLREKYPNHEFTLVGHSIGARMILDLYHTYPDCFDWHAVHKYLLLFPAPRFIGASPNAKRMYPLLRFFPAAAAKFFTVLTSILPVWIMRLLIRARLGTIPQTSENAVLDLASGPIIENCLRCADGYMETQGELPQIHHEIHSKFIIYTHHTDGWLSAGSIEKMEEVYPESILHRCTQGYKHAFCVLSSEPMARMSWEWLR
eukprot:m.135470 g.135470  ORF g.135470 m.135470 type:complete len:386 (+) comp29797_c0_seq1:15-1172(+)